MKKYRQDNLTMFHVTPKPGSTLIEVPGPTGKDTWYLF